jgi:hypothetical protein
MLALTGRHMIALTGRHVLALNGRHDPEQARWVKTVNIHSRIAKSLVDKTVGYGSPRGEPGVAIDWVTRRSTLRVGLMYSQATVNP